MLGLGSSLVQGSSYSETLWVNTHSAFLDGTNDFFDTNYSTNILWRGDFTVMGHFWMLDGQPASAQTLFGLDAGGIGGDHVHCFVDTDGTVVLSHVSNGDSATTTTDAAVFANGSTLGFHHIAVTVQKQGTASLPTLYKIYKDGSEVASTTADAMTAENHLLIDVDATTLHFGAKGIAGSAATGFYGGFMDEIAVIQTHLSASAVEDVYNSDSVIDLTLPLYTGSNKLLLYYHLDNNPDDEKGTSDGTMTGAVFSTFAAAP
tara:strand:+ start:152 stop:934 length:783 start_codon:yes stop_codon:yes gene_type:complete